MIAEADKRRAEQRKRDQVVLQRWLEGIRFRRRLPGLLRLAERAGRAQLEREQPTR